MKTPGLEMSAETRFMASQSFTGSIYGFFLEILEITILFSFVVIEGACETTIKHKTYTDVFERQKWNLFSFCFEFSSGCAHIVIRFCALTAQVLFRVFSDFQ